LTYDTKATCTTIKIYFRTIEQDEYNSSFGPFIKEKAVVD